MSEAEHIESQAAEWLVRRDAAAPGESAEFTSWLASDPRHRAAYLRLAAAWERTTQMTRLRPEGVTVDADLLSPKPKRVFRLWTPLALAAGLSALGFSSFWWFAAGGDALTYRTDIGGLSRVILADGSTVMLNTDTEIRVRFAPKLRKVTLVRGEAQFTVAHNPSRPFEVAAAGRIVRDVGTTFDVRLVPNEALQVTVTEGQVALEYTPATGSGGASSIATVSAGESAVAQVGKLTIRHVSTTEASRHMAWEVGELSFQGETLEEATTEFNRYNHRKLRVEDPTIKQLQIGGTFQALDVQSFVEALEHSFSITATTSDDGTILLYGSNPQH